MADLIDHPSPNWNERPSGQAPDMVVIHYTGMRTGAEALARLCDPTAEVSAHYLIEEDGRIFRLVDEDNRAWHAGISSWQGRDNINHNSIGIELVNPGHEFGYRAFPSSQISSLQDLLLGIKKRHTIPTAHFIGHSDIAPERKTDPGELFPWKMLAEYGFGLWSDVDGSDTEVIARRGDAGDIIGNLNKQLGIVGYSLNDTGSFDAATESIIRAFQAHWRPETVSGCFDKGTAARLEDIVSQIHINGERL